MKRKQIIQKIGDKYHIENIENGEFSYSKALRRPIKGHKFIDLRFVKNNAQTTILVETKSDFKKLEEDKKQLFQYIKLEREVSDNDIISMLHYINDSRTFIWVNDVFLEEETFINSFSYYENILNVKKNDKFKVLNTTNTLNKILHKFSIKEELRSQLVGTILIALNNGMEYSSILSTKEMIERIIKAIDKKINDKSYKDDDNFKAKRKILLSTLDQQSIKELANEKFVKLLNLIKKELIPYINSSTNEGEDLLNLFFTTFNKYVGKKDKNQAYTPTHITDFMSEIVDLSWNEKVLDPTCGSGAFLVQAMTKMLKKAGNNEEKKQKIKKEQLFGIENEEKAFGLATTNMLIHEDGKSNIKLDSCFNLEKFIKASEIDVVLMNPPFNGQKMPSECPVDDKDHDKTKGLFFVNYIANAVGSGLLATVLPISCAIGSQEEIFKYKHLMLKQHTLKAVFTMPEEIFYPGASVHTCIMLFQLGKPHDSNKKTFFGYYKDDGFVKKKNMGRIEKTSWENTKKKWLDAFNELNEVPGFSIKRSVTAEDEWLAEAYMETDYSHLSEKDFIDSIKSLLSFEIKYGGLND